MIEGPGQSPRIVRRQGHQSNFVLMLVGSYRRYFRQYDPVYYSPSPGIRAFAVCALNDVIARAGEITPNNFDNRTIG